MSNRLEIIDAAKSFGSEATLPAKSRKSPLDNDGIVHKGGSADPGENAHIEEFYPGRSEAEFPGAFAT